MKRTAQRRSGGGKAAPAPREIRVRMPAPRPAEGRSDVWVVNGRVIRFLDPSRPDEVPVPEHRPGRIRGLLSGLRPHRRSMVRHP